MHEMGIAQQLAKIAMDAIPRDLEEPKVQIINLKIGQLAAVVENTLKTCFAIVAKDSVLEGAEINIESVPVSVYCQKCETSCEVEISDFTCPECEGGDVVIETGREIQIVSIEFDEQG